jgi:hypothetical protein
MDLHALSHNTNLLENRVNNMGIQIYNKTPVSIKILNKYKIFKRNLKSSLINHEFYSVD